MRRLLHNLILVLILSSCAAPPQPAAAPAPRVAVPSQTATVVPAPTVPATPQPARGTTAATRSAPTATRPPVGGEDLVVRPAVEGPGVAQMSASLAAFPLAKGTTWHYVYVGYEPAPANPTQIITATYRLTDTVVGTNVIAPYFVGHVRRAARLVAAAPGWTDSGPPGAGDLWYVVAGHQIYESAQPLDLTRVNTETLILAYDLPLAVGKTWCPQTFLKGQRIEDCRAAGQRTVASQGSYETPDGKFDDCYRITEAVNSGGVTRWFCNGRGIVAAQYDHGGTRFGFRQILVGYTSGPA